MDVRRLFFVILTTAIVLLGALASTQQKSSQDSVKTAKPGIVDTYDKMPEGNCVSNCSADKTTTTQGTSSDTPSTSGTSNSYSGGSTSSSSKFVAPTSTGSCTETVVPYHTEYVDDPNMYVGTTRTSDYAANGSIQHCPGSPDTRVEPINPVVYTGTKPKPSAPAKTYDEAASYCSGHGVPVNSSAWQQCIDAYLR